MDLTGKHPPLIVILGPTAIGKTDAAIQLANAIDGEIISADSRQIYKLMDIGTAKPTPEQQSRATHHLIDMVYPDENLGLAEYQDSAFQIFDEIHSRQKVPLLVGGTGQYISAVVEGWSIPKVPPNRERRQELEAFAESNGSHALYDRLNRIDAAAAEKIHPNNVRRVIRALEVYEETGIPFSELQKKQPRDYSLLVLGLTWEREKLLERAYKRVDMMMEQGFLDEVRGLLDHGYTLEMPAMSALGYPELLAHVMGDLSLEEAIEKVKISTRQFIRKQYIWFRGHDHDTIWHNIGDEFPDTLIQETQNWLGENA